MAIPASVGLYINWVHGSIATNQYTSNTPEVPDAYVLSVNDSNVEVEAASPWNGQTLLDVQNHWNDGFSSTLTSSEMAATAGRLLIEVDSIGSGDNGKWFLRIEATTANNFTVRADRISGSPDYLRVFAKWNGASSDATVAFAAFPAATFALEIIYDMNNSTANQRLRARYWTIGGTAPAFTDATNTNGSAATSDQPTTMQGGYYNNDTMTTRFGRIIISNDIAEDLSAVSEGAGIVVPVFVHHMKMQGFQ